jgi:glycosyltransferase involved in cell wall biosynthesis
MKGRPLAPSTHERRDRAPRVLILVENAPVPCDRRVIEEARSLSANGYVVSVIAPAAPGEPRRESLDGIEVRRFRPIEAHGGARAQVIEYLNALVQTLWLMITLSRSPGFDVVEACNPPDLFFLIVWPFKLAGTRFIFDQHDLSPELYASLYSRDRGFLMRVLRWAERRSYRMSDAVLVCNDSYRRLALSRGGVDPDRVFTVRNGPRENWPIPMPPNPALKSDRPYLVVYMGIMGFQDGLDVLMEAVHTLVHTMDFREATFALVGDGSAVESLKEQVRALGIEEYVRFAGWIEDEETMSLYLATADACVCPEPSSPLNDQSTFAKVMEYMAAQKPLIAFDLPETRFSAQDAAAYATPGDVEGFATRIREVLTDEALRTKMTSAAAARIPSLRWECQVPALLAAYDRALRTDGEG